VRSDIDDLSQGICGILEILDPARLGEYRLNLIAGGQHPASAVENDSSLGLLGHKSPLLFVAGVAVMAASGMLQKEASADQSCEGKDQ